MLTQCSICGTVFRVRAEQLSAARGIVECGECETQFNALDRLIDEPGASMSDVGDAPRPPPSDAVTAPLSATTQSAGRPAFVLLDADDGESEPTSPDSRSDRSAPPDTHGHIASVEAPPSPVLEEEGRIESEEDAADVWERTLDEEGSDQPPADPGPPPLAEGWVAPDASVLLGDVAEIEAGQGPPVGPSLSAEEHDVLFTDPGVGDEPEVDLAEDDDTLDDVPLLLKDQMTALRSEQVSRSSIKWLWILSAMLLGAALILQLAWAHRETVFEKIPGVRAHAMAICARIGCDVNPEPAPDSIELRARDVRDHPQYRDALLVNATLVNRAKTACGYPVIELDLYDHIGNVLGVRRFEPHEYLDESIDIAAGMPAGRPIFIVLEVAAAGKTATSFEFKFL